MNEDAPNDPEMRLALAYAPAEKRGALETLFALDARLGGIVARTSEPMIGLMRLTWWRDALEALDTAPAPAEPLLEACARIGRPGAELAALTAGWEALLDDPDLGDEAVALHGAERGARLFGIAGALLGQDDARLGAAGEGWARVDLARHLDRPERRGAILASARAPLAAAKGAWPRRLRALGQLAMSARGDAERGTIGVPGSRRRLIRIMTFQLTGR